MENLFGSDNSDGSLSSPEQSQENQEIPSTQTQMKDLFGDSDGSKNSSSGSKSNLHQISIIY